jgi:hypothetical protein
MDLGFVLFVTAMCGVGVLVLVYPFLFLYSAFKYPNRLARWGGFGALKIIYMCGWVFVSGALILVLVKEGVAFLLRLLGF